MTGAIILAAGSGQRMKHSMNKQYIDLGGSPILAYSLRTFCECPVIDAVILVIQAEEEGMAEATIAHAGIDRSKIQLVEGGEERQDSVYLALREAPSSWTKVLIHDGARPFLSCELIKQVADAVSEETSIVPGLPVTDTIKNVDDEGYVRNTVNREGLVTVQTPQGFNMQNILNLHERAQEERVFVTDDAALCEIYRKKVRVVPGDPLNFKITHPQDLAQARMIINTEEGKNLGSWNRI